MSRQPQQQPQQPIPQEQYLTALEREKLIQMLTQILSRPCSPSEYNERIGYALVDLNIPNEKFLQCCAKCLQRVNTNYNDTIIISAYLFRMPNFLKIFNDIEETQINTHIRTVAKHLQYEKLDKNMLMMKLGDVGKKAYILLSGNVDVIIKSPTSMKVAVRDYILYVAKLLKYKEYGLINCVINDNFPVYPLIIEYDLNQPNVLNNNGNDTGNNNNMVINMLEQEQIDKNEPPQSKREKDKKNEIESYFKLNTTNQSLRRQTKVIKFKASQLLLLVNYNINIFQQNNASIANINNYNNDPNGSDSPQLTRKKEKEMLYSTTTANYIDRIKINVTLPDESSPHYKHHTFSPNEEDKPITVNIYSYMKVASLTTGTLFGEIALSNPLAQRTASIVTTSFCHFGTLNKNSYNLSLKACKDKQIQKTLKFITSNQVFKGLNTLRLNKKYLNNFEHRRITKGEFILEQEEKPKSIYLLKEGEYEITIKSSLFDLVEVIKNLYMKLPNASKKIEILNRSQRVIMNEAKDNQKMQKVIYSTKTIHLSTAECPNVVGLSDFIDDGKYMFNVECKSAKGEYMVLKNVFYKDMRMREYTIEENEIEFVQQKIKIIIDRMNNIRNSKIQTFFDFKQFTHDLGSEIENDIQKNNALKRKKDTQKTVINAKDIKLDNNNNPNENIPKSKFTPFLEEIPNSTPPQRDSNTRNQPSPRKKNLNLFNSSNSNVSPSKNNNLNTNINNGGTPKQTNYSLFKLNSSNKICYLRSLTSNIDDTFKRDGSFAKDNNKNKDMPSKIFKENCVENVRASQQQDKAEYMSKSSKFWRKTKHSQTLKLKETPQYIRELQQAYKRKDTSTSQNFSTFYRDGENKNEQIIYTETQPFFNKNYNSAQTQLKLEPIESLRLATETRERKKSVINSPQNFSNIRNRSEFKYRQAKRTNTVSIGKININPLTNVPEHERAKHLQITINDIRSLFKKQLYSSN